MICHILHVDSKMLKPTFFGLLKVTLVMPGTCFNPSFAIDFRAFFSLREWTWIEDPAGIPVSPSAPAASGSSESELLDASSTSAPFFAGGSSGSSSIRGFDMVRRKSLFEEKNCKLCFVKQPAVEKAIIFLCHWNFLERNLGRLQQ